MPVLYTDPAYVEAVYAALFALLQTALPNAGLPAPYNTSLKFNTTERVVWVPDQIPVANQPAMLVVQGPAEATQRELFGPTKWTFTAVAVVYFRVEGSFPPSPEGSTIGNYIMWSVAQALARTPNPYDKQTLGGLVYHCWIEGEVFLEVVEEQAMLTFPIHILSE